MIKVVNVKDKAEGYHYVGRSTKAGKYVPSPLGNPFRIIRGSTRKDVIEMFEGFLNDAIAWIEDEVEPVIQIMNKDGYFAAYNEFSNLVDHAWMVNNLNSQLIEYGLIPTHKLHLGCHCSPEPCHADIIKRKIEERL